MTQNNDRLDRRRLGRRRRTGAELGRLLSAAASRHIGGDRNRDLGGRALNLFRGGSEREPRLVCYARNQTDI